jgi:hypothetical protein
MRHFDIKRSFLSGGLHYLRRPMVEKAGCSYGVEPETRYNIIGFDRWGAIRLGQPGDSGYTGTFIL